MLRKWGEAREERKRNCNHPNLQTGSWACITPKERKAVCKLEVVGVVNFSGPSATCSHMFMSPVQRKRLPFPGDLT